MLDAVRALLTPQSSTVLLSDAQEWGFTIGFFLLLVFAAYFLVKVATGDFDDLELPCWPARKKRSDIDEHKYAQPLLDDAYDQEVVEL